MALYQYQSEAGDVIERVRSMNDEHPEEIEVEGVVYSRVYGAGILPSKQYAVQHAKDDLPISHSLPSRDPTKGKQAGGVIEYRDGLTTDRKGKPIVANKADAANWEAATGFKRED